MRLKERIRMKTKSLKLIKIVRSLIFTISEVRVAKTMILMKARVGTTVILMKVRMKI